MAKAGDNEKKFNEQINEFGISLKNKKTFKNSDNVSISTDNSFGYNGKTILLEIDSGNMAKLLVGQYTLLNTLIDEKERQNYFFLVVHFYVDKKYGNYNIQRTIKNLNLINEKCFSGNGVQFNAIHFNDIKTKDDLLNLIN